VRILLQKATLRFVLRSFRRLFGTTAVVMLGYYGFVLADGWLYQKREQRSLEQLVAAAPTPTKAARLTVTGALIGRIAIPRLGLSVVVGEGVDARTLRRAAGHIPGTGLPGQPGNVGISGHRDTFFRPLQNIRQDDIITVTMVAGDFRYRVVSIWIVSPADVSVLETSADEVLTLVTCYPFYFVGAAPERFIVRAIRVTG
jgi:sortase A